MKQIVIISGKGGTGKTVITASFAALAKNKVMADCDVDAADLHLLLHPEIKERFEFKGLPKAVINQDRCTGCGECEKVCRYDAIIQVKSPSHSLPLNSYLINKFSCEGCRFCMYVCPVGAISMEDNIAGEWYISETKYGPMVHAKLGIAEENSGKLVAQIRKVAKEIAEKNKSDYIIIDGPPGIGCPVIASLSGVDLAIIVTEPTLSGIHDMERIIEVAKHFSVPIQVIINKADINISNSTTIEKFCESERIPVLGRLPFSYQVVESVKNGVPFVEYCKGQITSEITNMWQKIIDMI